MAVDLRPDSPTRLRWVGETLSAENRRMLFIPKGFAHGFVTLEDESEVFYQMSESYYPECARGFRWDDPAFGIEWPVEPEVISDQDRERTSFDPDAWRAEASSAPTRSKQSSAGDGEE